jgi:PAS domain S-box-containing protein
MQAEAFIRKNMNNQNGTREHFTLTGSTGRTDNRSLRERIHRRLQRLLMPVFFALLIVIVWLNELLDIPHHLFGMPRTPSNWQESALETLFILLAALAAWMLTHGAGIERTREKRLHERQKIFSNILIRESPTYFLAANPDGSIITASSALLSKTGYTLDEVVGKDALSLFFPVREHQAITREMTDFVQSGKSKPRTSHIVTKTGEEFIVQWEGTVVYHENGTVDFIYGAGIDITAQKRTERALRLSEERYRSFVQNLQGIAYQLDMELRPVFMHGNVEKITGYREDEFLNATVRWEDFIFAEDLAGIRANFQKAKIVPNYTGEYTYRIIRMDGTLCWVREYFRSICGEDGRPAAIQGTVYDITAERQAEEALRASDARYRFLAENMSDVIWAVDMDMRYTYISPSVEKARGYTVEEAMGLPMEKVFTPGSYRELKKILAGLRDAYERKEPAPDGRTRTQELEMLRKDGSAIWVEITGSLILDIEGRPAGYVGMTRDITERKRAEEAIRQSEETYRTIFTSTGTAMIIIEEDTTIALANSEFEHLSGYPREDIEGKKPWTDFVVPEDIDRIMKYHVVRRMQDSKAPRNYDFRFKDTHGMLKDLYVTATLLPGTRKSLISLLDITRTKKAAEELRISQEQLRNLHKHSQDVRERERTRIAREIHDELGQVLTALKMDLSYLAKKLPPDLAPLGTKVDHMLKFVDMTIQTVKRITMDLRPGLLDHLGLVAAIEWQAGEFQNRTGIRCSLTVDPDDITLRPDQATSVFRIFQEALTNVARHARATEVKTSLIAIDGLFEMTVKDNGVGITKEQLENAKSYGLMGIKERAYFCGGKAGISGKKGKGTTVVISIPFDDARVHDDTSACG